MREEVADRGFREIFATLTTSPDGSECVRVYQAYNEPIASSAAAANSFSKPRDAGIWKETRMTWIKPSAAWMAYRCGWTLFKGKNQARVLALDLDRAKFEELLMEAAVTDDMPADQVGSFKEKPVVVQWDPERLLDASLHPSAGRSSGDGSKADREPYLRKVEHVRSLQVGLRGRAAASLLDPSFVRCVTDVTTHFQAAHAALAAGDLAAAKEALCPDERRMEVAKELRQALRMDEARETCEQIYVSDVASPTGERAVTVVCHTSTAVAAAPAGNGGVVATPFCLQSDPQAVSRSKMTMADDRVSISRWTHFLVLDFEATCERNDPTQKAWSELIEFPCVLLDASTLETVAEFRSFVRPTGRPKLSHFCTELTSITQQMVDDAPMLGEVLKHFNVWLPEALGTSDLSRVLPVTCGEPDLSSMLPRECERKRLRVPSVLTRYCNVKKPFSELLGAKAGGMAEMLRKLKLELIGHHHSGIDDARNIARIVAHLVLRGATIDATGGRHPELLPDEYAEPSSTLPDQIDDVAVAAGAQHGPQGVGKGSRGHLRGRGRSRIQHDGWSPSEQESGTS